MAGGAFDYLDSKTETTAYVYFPVPLTTNFPIPQYLTNNQNSFYPAGAVLYNWNDGPFTSGSLVTEQVLDTVLKMVWRLIMWTNYFYSGETHVNNALGAFSWVDTCAGTQETLIGGSIPAKRSYKNLWDVVYNHLNNSDVHTAGSTGSIGWTTGTQAIPIPTTAPSEPTSTTQLNLKQWLEYIRYNLNDLKTRVAALEAAVKANVNAPTLTTASKMYAYYAPDNA